MRYQLLEERRFPVVAPPPSPSEGEAHEEEEEEEEEQELHPMQVSFFLL
jgi:CO dehydrogenase/acetyl-CoA synthase beta subunit